MVILQGMYSPHAWGWTVNIEPLDVGERTRLIQEYVALFTKAISPARIESIAFVPRCWNPLFLHALTDELRLFGCSLRDFLKRSSMLVGLGIRHRRSKAAEGRTGLQYLFGLPVAGVIRLGRGHL